MSRRQKWVLWPIAALAALIVLLVLIFDWNWLKGPVESAASAALDREVEIAGDLKVDLSMTPRITLEQVRVANAAWGTRPDMLTIPRAAFALELSRLLRGELRLPFLEVQEPDLLLETNLEGEGNWQFAPPDEPPSAPSVPAIEDLRITDAAIRYHEPGRRQDIGGSLATVEGSLTDAGVRLSAEGTFEGEPLAVSVESAPVDQLDAPAERFPFELVARLGASRLTATGSAEQLLQAQGLEVEVALASEDPATLLELAGREPSGLGDLDLGFSLAREDEVWHLRQIDLRLADSDLRGDVSYDGRGEVPALAADLRSDRLQVAALRDLAALAATGGAEAAEEVAIDVALADAREALQDQTRPAGSLADRLGVGPDMLPAIDAEVRYAVGRLSGPELELQDVALDGRLQERLPHGSLSGRGVYKGEPVTLDLRLGDAAAEGDGDAYLIRGEVAAAGTRADLEGMLARPAELDGLELRFDVASRQLGDLLALAGVEAPPVPPFELSGQLVQDGASWQLSELDGRLGESDLRGRAAVELREPEPLITAELASDQLRVEDLQAVLPGDATPDAAADDALETAIAEAKVALGEPPQDADDGFGLRRDMLPMVDVEVSYRARRISGPDLALADVDLYARLKDRLPRLALTGGGEFRGAPVTIAMQLGAAEPAGDDAAYPVQARLEAAGTQLRIDGVIGEPETLRGLDLQVEASSEDLDAVLALAGLDLPQIPPFALDGHLVQNGQVWRLDDFAAQFRESNLSGRVTLDLSQQRPSIAADLRSDRLRMSDLIAARERAEAVEEAVDESEPDEEPEPDEEAEPDGWLLENGDLAALEALPEIDADLELRASQVELPDEIRFEQLLVDLQLRDRVPVLAVSGEGSFREQPLSLEARAGTEETFSDPDARYPLEVALRSADASLDLNGSVNNPRGLAGLDVDAALGGQDLAILGKILQLPLPRTPPYRLAGKLTHQVEHQRWNLVALRGEIGDSDLSGDVSLELSSARPTLVADLHSESLDFDDLGVMVGAPTGTEAGETASPEQEREAEAAPSDRYVLSDEPFAVPELRAIDARVEYGADAVRARGLPLEGVLLSLTLLDGTLSFEPLRFNLAGGELDAVAVFHGQGDVLDGEIELTLRSIKLNQLFRHFDVEIAEIELEQEGVGTFGGQAKLRTEGRSVRELAASSHGDVAVIMDGGQINALIIEAIGLDVGEALALLVSDADEEQTMVPLECFVGQFVVEGGVMQTEALVLKTSDSTITGHGQIDLGEERLALELLAHPRDASALTASTPVRIEGTFKAPEIELVSEELQEKSLAALALGVVLPVVGAVLPFIETGENEDPAPSCATLIRDAEQKVDVPDEATYDRPE